jgi:co-chaperonin GroES (HSP10)
MEQARSRAQILDDIKWLKDGQFNVPGKKVMIFQDPAEKYFTTADGKPSKIEVPDTFQFEPQRGTVMLIGAAVDEDELHGMEKGHRCIFNKYQPTQVTIVDRNGNRLQVLLIHPANVFVNWPYGFGLLEDELAGGDIK